MGITQKLFLMMIFVIAALCNAIALSMEDDHAVVLSGRVNLDPVEVDLPIDGAGGAGPSVVSDELPWRDYQCGICLDQKNPLMVCLPHPGAHVFHKECLLSWLNQQLTCPCCRRRLIIQEVKVLPEHTVLELWNLMKMGEEDELARKMREIIEEQRRGLEVEYMGEEDGVSRSIRMQEREQKKGA